jgi:predicted ATPase
MSGLSANIQSALKLAACFGIKIKESVVETLGTDPKHSDVQDNLEQVVKGGFMVKVGTSDFKFVHDKVREAAYGLIPEQEKNQVSTATKHTVWRECSYYLPNISITTLVYLSKYHYTIGMSLYSMTKGQDVDDVIFSIVDQLKLGIDSLDDESPEFRIEVAKLNELAGMKAVVCSDYVTSRSYFTYALSLLPIDHWKSHYDISLRCSLRLAKSHYSCGDVEKAQSILQDMIGQCHSFEDKLPACELLARSKMHAWFCSLEMCSPDFVLLTMAIVC